jgi:hypothetical protein
VPAHVPPPGDTGAPLGWIRWMQGDVTVNGRSARNGQPLHRGDRVATLEGGRARIRFSDTDEAQMGECALVVMLGRDPDRMDAGEAAQTHLETGRLREHLQRLAGGG